MTTEDFRNLTEEQAEFLVELAKIPRGIGPGPTFQVRYHGGRLRFSAQSPDTGLERDFYRSRRGTLETLRHFHQMGFIHLHEHRHTAEVPLGNVEQYAISFILLQKTHDYLEWWRLPHYRKTLRALMENWASDLRAGIIAVVVTLLTYLVTTLIANSCSSSVFSNPVLTP